MADRQVCKEAGPGETHSPPLTPEKFRESLEFRRLRTGMKRLLKVPKVELDRRIAGAKEASPRAGNPNAPGRKKAGHDPTTA